MSSLSDLTNSTMRNLILIAVVQGLSYVALSYALTNMPISFFGLIMCLNAAITVYLLTNCKISFNRHVVTGAGVTCMTFVCLFASVKYNGAVVTAIAASLVPIICLYIENRVHSNQENIKLVTVCCLITVMITNLMSAQLKVIEDISLSGIAILIGYVFAISTGRILRTREYMTNNERHSSLMTGLYLSAISFGAYYLLSSDDNNQILLLLELKVVLLIPIVLGVITTGLGMLLQDNSTVCYPIYFIESVSILKVHIASFMTCALSFVTTTNINTSIVYLSINLSVFITAIVVMHKTLNIKEFQHARL
ncbi:MAG TPA: hypothetical protein DEO86_15800 [Colwellia sp.]|nr:hypothetical protein [Colwellia sp.]|tara:strand:- start:1402 stop:2325 length:924 start_codon:yes stop_codon:yes gene_type:complete